MRRGDGGERRRARVARTARQRCAKRKDECCPGWLDIGNASSSFARGVCWNRSIAFGCLPHTSLVFLSRRKIEMTRFSQELPPMAYLDVQVVLLLSTSLFKALLVDHLLKWFPRTKLSAPPFVTSRLSRPSAGR